MIGRHLLVVSFTIGAAASILGLAACDDSNAVKESVRAAETGPSAPLDGGVDATGQDSSADGAPTDCVLNPTTHVEILNACTDAVKITKNPTLPLLLPDGGLPTPP